MTRTIVPVADDVTTANPEEALDSETTKPSSNSTALSADTVTATTLVVSPAAKLTLPAGRVPPKSAALAACAFSFREPQADDSGGAPASPRFRFGGCPCGGCHRELRYSVGSLVASGILRSTSG